MSFYLSPYDFETPRPEDDDTDDLMNTLNFGNDLDRASQSNQLETTSLHANDCEPIDSIPPSIECEAYCITPEGNEKISNDSQSKNAQTAMEIEETPGEDGLKQEITAILKGDNLKLKALIEKLLQGVEPNDQELQELHDVERNIFMSIKEKKLCTDEERNNRGKRAEEKQKMFFKGVLKFAENAFFDSLMKSKKKIRKKQLDQKEFYNYYFLETSRRLNIDISNFYHPNKKFKGKESSRSQSTKAKASKANQNAGLKSFNATYLDLILSSDKFREQALYFLDEVFVQDYIKTRYKKIDKLLQQLKKILSNSIQAFEKVNSPTEDGYVKKLSKFKPELNKEQRQHILYNSKSKLPWSTYELEEAREFARLTFKKYL